jgi:hypothetical protein
LQIRIDIGGEKTDSSPPFSYSDVWNLPACNEFVNRPPGNLHYLRGIIDGKQSGWRIFNGAGRYARHNFSILLDKLLLTALAGLLRAAHVFTSAFQFD